MINEDPGKGHNSGNAIGGIASEGLRQLVTRIETPEEETCGLQADIKAVSVQDRVLAVYEEVLA
ncbi:hypothetical protein AY555_06415 [Haematospirillum jordaniae]|uniref:Uncharacterized protein n=2 Tax=Haematospirillum jordaniae TaxID=1549855 RepID=A0A143DEC4_9PROT|nr:hypothetical protein [Haematospirillum jordaniae]AMW34870.1 hypothetical protein AY555_06415 [Haematospirillum jordaniae]NKD81162.1 DUF2312 domain-containing protein [Haematospirillum jordaniae]